MDTTTAVKRLTTRANLVFAENATARERLTEALAHAQGVHLDSLMDRVLVTAADAQPWHNLLLRIERLGVREALAVERRKATEALIEYGFGMSTSLITNAARFHEQNGLRRFLTGTDHVDIDEETVEPAIEAAVQEPAKAPEPAKVPAKLTPAQSRTLQVIALAQVVIRETLSGKRIVDTRPGFARPRVDMVQQAIDKGWATLDASKSYCDGRAVTLNEAGRAILAG
ncbi:hypothetical protein [Embleya sp. NPDC001921]